MEAALIIAEALTRICLESLLLYPQSQAPGDYFALLVFNKNIIVLGEGVYNMGNKKAFVFSNRGWKPEASFVFQRIEVYKMHEYSVLIEIIIAGINEKIVASENLHRFYKRHVFAVGFKMNLCSESF